MKSKNGCRLVLIAVAAFMLSAAVVTISIESDDLTDAAPPYTDKDYLILRGSTTATYDLYKWDTVSGDWMTDTVMWDELPTIQSAVDIIKSDAAAEECSITFDGATTTAGIGTSTLEIGNTGIMFNNSDSGWSAAGVTLYGSLSATNSTSLTAVSAYDGMVINSYADIFQTSTDAQSNVIIIASSELNIFGGTMSSTNYGNAIYNMSGTVNISGGTVSTNWGITIRAFGEGLITIWDDPGMPGAPLIESGGLYAAIEIRDTGNEVERLNITGGTVRNLGSQVGLYLSTTYSSEAITNNSKGIVNISGDATVENYNPSGTTGGTITISNKGILNISENAVIHNYSTTQSCTTIINYNILNISGGRVSSTAGQSVENSYYASTIMSGGEISGRNGILNGGYVSIFDDLALPDKPIINTDGMGINIYRPGGGIAPDQVMVDITGGIIQSSNNAIFNQTYGIVNISGDTFIESTSSGSTGGAVRNSSAGTVNVFGEATIQNLAGDSNNRAVLNQSTGTVNIFSGELMTTAGNTIHNQSTGTVNISGGEVSSATGYAVYAQGTGKVTIWDDPSISDSPFLTTGGSSTIYVANATGNIEVRLEITGGTVQNTGATNNSCHAIYNASSGIVDISGDTTVQNYNSSGTAGNTWTINNSSNGIINMSDDVKVQNFSTDASARAINNNAGGEVNISGGDVTSIAGRTIHNQSTGTVNISGGEISSTTGYVIYAQGAGKITIFDDPSIQGSPLLTTGGSNTISIAAVSGNTDMRLEITGGTVQNTGTTSSSFYAVNNASAGSVNISGDAVVRNYNPAGTAGGTQTIYNNSSGTVNISENAKVQNFSTDTGARAIYNGVGAGTVNISGGEVTAAAGRAIHNNAAGTANITGGTVQNDSTEPTIYNYGAGKINISGGEVIATSGNAIYAYGAGTITVSDDPFIAGSPLVTSGGARTIDIRAISGNTDVRLEITGGTVENTSSTANGGQAIYNSSSGSVNISGDAMVQNYNPAGTAGNTWTISNGSTGELNISGDAVVQNCSTGSDARAIFNHSTGTVNISGGEVTVAAGRVIQNNATGTVNISGGIVQNSGTDAAIYNNAAGKVNITGGTVRNDGTGNAIYNSTGRINLGGAPDVIGDIYTAPNTLATLTDLTATPPQISFDPGVKTYDLMLSSEYNGAIAVIDGTTFLKNFVHKNTSDFTMKDNLAHLILVATVTITIGTSPDNLGIVPKVTDASSNPVTGTASGNKWTFQVEKSAEFTIEVPATDAGSLWNFKEWDDDPTASAVRIVSNGADSDKEYTAVYSRATVTITIGTSPDNLGIVPKVIDASSNPITGTASGNKWVFSVEKSAEFTIEVSVTDAGSLWNFKEWDDDPTASAVRIVSNGADSDKEYTAVYSRAMVTITIGTSPDDLGIMPVVTDASSNPIAGTASGNKWVFSVEKSAEFTIEVSATDVGSLWDFMEWDDDQTTSPVRTVANGTDSDKEYTAVYSRAMVTITIGTSPDDLGIMPVVTDASSNPIAGTASGNKWVFSVEKSAEFTIEIPTSDAGSLWNFKEWDDDQTTSPVRTVANGTDSDKEYTAVYIEMQPPGPPGSKVYYIDASADGNSTISPNGKVSVEGGASKTFTFSAAEGYRITEVSVDGVSLPQSQIDHGSYTFFNVNMNHTIVVKSAEGSGGNGDGESDDGNGDGDGNGTGNSNRESDGGEDEGNGTLVIKDNIWLWGPLIFIVLLVLLGLLIWFLLFRGRSGLIITVRKNREAVKGAAVNYSIKMDGKTENGTIMTNSKGKCRIKAKKDSVVTISMVAKDGDIATNLPVVMVMEHRREHLELMLG